MDYMVRGMARQGHVRVFANVSTEICREAERIHGTSPNVTAALGRLLTGAAMMGLMQKDDKAVLSLVVRSDGPIGGLTVSADSHGNVKGFPNNAKVPFVEKYPGKLDVGKSVGRGTLIVVKDDGITDKPYSSQTPLVDGEIADDLTYYFAESEQIPSAVGLGVLVDTDASVKAAGGFIIQMMPDADDSDIEAVEKRVKKIKSVTDHFKDGKTPEQLLEYIFEEEDGLSILEKSEIRFHCNCNRDRVSKALISIGKKDLIDLAKEGKPVELKCEYCRKSYKFTPEELKAFAEK